MTQVDLSLNERIHNTVGNNVKYIAIIRYNGYYQSIGVRAFDVKGYDQSTVNSIFLHQNRCFQSEKILRFFYVLIKGSLTEFHFQSEKKTKKKHCVSFMFYVKGNLYYKSLKACYGTIVC